MFLTRLEDQRREAASVLLFSALSLVLIGSSHAPASRVSQVHQLHRIMASCVLVYVSEARELGRGHYSPQKDRQACQHRRRSCAIREQIKEAGVRRKLM